MSADVPSDGSVLYRLMATIQDRRQNPPPRSYTTSLFAAGIEAMGAKIREEAREVVEAAQEMETGTGREHLIHEAADLTYHLFVLLGYHEVTLAELEAELARRFGVSGLDEKASRREKEQS